MAVIDHASLALEPIISYKKGMQICNASQDTVKSAELLPLKLYRRMFALRTVTASLVLLLSALSTQATGPGTISAPANGTQIAPGEAFDFNYITRGDYGVSTYNISVWLATTPPTSFAQADVFMTGHYFGRFSYDNTGPSPPAQLVMPNFATPPGGFGAGSNATNVTTYFTVLEEYADFTVRHFSLL